MRVLHIYKDYYPVLGGIENHMKVLAEAQASAGHEVTALVCDPSFRTRIEQIERVNVVKTGRLATMASMPLSLRQPLALFRQRPDIAHIHSPYPLGEAANWLVGRARATVTTHHSDIVRQKGWLRLYGPVFRRVLRAVDKIIATSPRYIETSPWLGPLSDKCTVIPLAVDVRRFTPRSTSVGRSPGRQLTLLLVGRLRYYKGLDTLLCALVDLPDLRLQVVGDGPMQTPWETLATELGVADRVTFRGRVGDEDLPECYRQADIFVLPANARAEAFGTVLLEAMACGLPCITTEVGSGTSWVVEDGVTGLVVPPRDPEALATAIRSLLDAPDKMSEMGKAGRNRVEAEFTTDKMVARVQAVYDEVLAH